MATINSIKVDLTQHSLDRLIERHAAFVNYTPSDAHSVIAFLNQNYGYGIIRGTLHKFSASQLELEFPNSLGIFYLVGHQRLLEVYFAETFKLFSRTPKKKEQQEVAVEYSFNHYVQKENRPLSNQEVREIKYLARTLRISTKGKTIGQLKSEVSKFT